MQKTERELIEEKFKGVYLHQQANFDLMNEKLEQIYKQTVLTNSNVARLEKETKVVRFLETKPAFLYLIILCFISISVVLDLDTIIKVFKIIFT